MGKVGMICYQDRTFCTAECANDKCEIKLTPKVERDAVKWWGEPGAPICQGDLSSGCSEYQPFNSNEQGEMMEALKQDLYRVISFIFDNEEDFKGAICSQYAAFELLEFYMAGERCRMTFLTDEGEHFTDTVNTDEVLHWYMSEALALPLRTGGTVLKVDSLKKVPNRD